jgi:pyruvate formate-lyase activating enzyme-like uncharacterized protein
MIIEITEETHGQIQNPVFASYAAAYLDIYDNFMQQIAASGIGIDADGCEVEAQERMARLRRKGAIFRNHGRSIYLNQISPACVACQKGIGSATFFVSLRCHRDCYYCFNPNQMHYDHFTQHKRDLVEELAGVWASGQKMNHLAITGGEPLLHKDEVAETFRFAREKFPDTYQRLYTCGDHADEEILQRLGAAGLDEIRFSIRMHDWQRGQRHTMERISLACAHIPTVMVEMPVLPGTLDEMKEILLQLDRLGVHSINLLEFCYPFANAGEFNRRGFKVKKRPFQTLYNYWYAGGVPVARSEMECLALLEFAIDQGLSLGVHYCSLENKLTGQNYQQNHGRKIPKTALFSEQDYLLKSAKVFGRDIGPVTRALRKSGYYDYQRNGEHSFLEFHVNQIPTLASLDVEIGLSTVTLEERDAEPFLRELKIDLTYPASFELAHDV